MYKDGTIVDKLKSILEALERIPDRFKDIAKPSDFITTPTGREHLDSICMVLLAVGESLKQINQKTEGELLSIYLDVPWQKIMGLRNVLAHVYFEVDEEQIYDGICENNIEDLIDTIQAMIQSIENGTIGSEESDIAAIDEL